MACCGFSNFHCILVLIILYICLKIYNKLTTGVYRGKVKLHGKTVVVTGANSGIGYQCAKDFAKRGAKVIMACRNMVTAEKAKSNIIKDTKNDNIKLKHIDFMDLDSVRKCANEILSEETRIDVLLNNAGIGSDDSKITKDGLNPTMEANHFGPFLFTNILLGKIKNTAPSRIVNVSSIAHTFANLDVNNYKGIDTMKRKLYANSKLANILFTNELARLLEGTNVTVNSLHPGVIGTEITRSRPIYFQIIWKFVSNLFFKSLNEGAQTSIYLCVASEVSGVTGKYFKDCKEAIPSDAALNMEFAKKLWELSENVVELQPNEKHY